MAGILDKKTRILDTVITTVGRAQVPFGRLKFEFASFTDRHAFYALTGSLTGALQIADDASDRLYFEAPTNKNQDQVCLEVAEEGAFLVATPFQLSAENVSTESSDAIGITQVNTDGEIEVTTPGASQYLFLTATLLHNQSKFNFKDQRIIKNDESVFGGRTLTLSTGELNFELTNDNVGLDYNNLPPEKNIDEISAIHESLKFQHLPNFMFLPPINRTPPGVSLNRVFPFILIADYLQRYDLPSAMHLIALMPENNLQDRQYSFGGEVTGRPLMSEININDLTDIDLAAARRCLMYIGDRYYSATANAGDLIQFVENQVFVKSDSPVESFRIDETSNQNNIFAQVFEISDDVAPSESLKKLAIIDFGVLSGPSKPTLPDAFNPGFKDAMASRVFFAGKLYVDSVGALTFANIFTIVCKIDA